METINNKPVDLCYFDGNRSTLQDFVAPDTVEFRSSTDAVSFQALIHQQNDKYVKIDAGQTLVKLLDTTPANYFAIPWKESTVRKWLAGSSVLH